jgi:glycosyltransferase involved in cell wall biosynthesis
MACGTPAIGLKYRAIPEVLSGEFERFQINVGDISGLAHLLQSLNGWQQHDPTLGQRCRAYVEEHFSKERMVKGVERVLQQAVTLGSVQLGPSVDSLKAWLPDSVGI